MKISTIFAAAAVVAFGMSAQAAEENLMRGATEGATGNKGGLDSELVQHGWKLYTVNYTYEDETASDFVVTDITENWPDNVRLESQLSQDGTTVAFDGNGATFRWDSGNDHTRWFVYPVELPCAGIYTLSFKATEWNNYNGGESNFKNGSDQAWVRPMGIQVLLGTDVNPDGVRRITDFMTVSDYDYENFLIWPEEGAGQFVAMEHRVVATPSIELEAKDKGQHYIMLLGSHGMYFAGDFVLKLEQEMPPSGVAETFTDANIVSTSYYGLDGVEVANPAKGSIVIVKNILDNGKVSVSKKVVR